MELESDSHSTEYAFVRFVDDGVTHVTSVNNIKKFDPQNYEKKKLYKTLFTDGEYYKAHVIAIGETAAVAEIKGQEKRIKIPTSKFNETTEDETEEINNNTINRNREEIKKQKQQKNDLLTHNYNQIVNFTPAARVNVLTPNNENNMLKMEIQNLKREQKQLITELEEVRNLNKDLQKIVIENFKDFINSGKISEKTDNMEVGARENGNIHLGRNVFLPEHIYDSASMKAIRKDSLFIKEIARAVFGEKVLAESSVSGLPCNRTKSAPKPPLDPTKLMAIHDIVRYRLQCRGESQQKIEAICSTINIKIAEKIHDLTRPPRQKKKLNENNTEVVTDENDEEH